MAPFILKIKEKKAPCVICMYRCHKISGLITCNNSDFFFYTAINDDFFFTVVVFLKNIVLLPCQNSKDYDWY